MIATLTEVQIRRYARHLVLGSVGMRGQRKLAAASIRIDVDSAAAHVAIAYLAAAGVGTIALGGPVGEPIDEDEIAGAPLLCAADVRQPRGAVIAERIEELEPDVEVIPATAEHGEAIAIEPTDDPARALIAGGLAAARAIAWICRT